MKKLLLLIALIVSFGLNAQEAAKKNFSTDTKVGKLLNHFTFTATAGTGYYKNSTSKFGTVSLGELSVQYKVNSRFSIGVGTMGSILCDPTFLNPEGNPIELDDNGPGDDDGPDHDDDDGPGDDDDCEDEIGENIMGLITYQPLAQFPIFIRTGMGYSKNTKSPAYSIMLGYNQKLIAGFGIMAGVRYSDVVQTGNIRSFVSPIGGIKAELGLSWNF